MSSLDIIIVNWNAREHLCDCLDTVAELAGEVNIERVVIVDNASTDGSLDAVEARDYRIARNGVAEPQSYAVATREAVQIEMLPLTILRNRSNLGFAMACNQGARGSTAEYLLFLNPDTKLREGALRAPTSFLDDEANARAGIVGIQLVDEREHILQTCSRLPTPARAAAQMLHLHRIFPSLDRLPGEWNYEESREVEWVMGAFFMTRRALFEQLGGFDERFFVYMEEVDYSLRARRVGWTSWYVSDARAFHYGGATSEHVKDIRLFYFLRSRILYFFKHFGAASAAAFVAFVLVIGVPMRIVRYILLGRSPLSTVVGYARLCRDLPSILRIAYRS